MACSWKPRIWVLVTRNREFLEQPVVDSARQEITIPRKLRLWTDDYNSLLPILRLRNTDTTSQ